MSPPKTCRIILSNLPQLFSSELSTQSICPSHTHFLGIQWPILHLNWSELQVTAKEIKISDSVKTRNKVSYKIYNILFYTFTYFTCCFVYWFFVCGLFNNAFRSLEQTITWKDDLWIVNCKVHDRSICNLHSNLMDYTNICLDWGKHNNDQ
jgi:hypothetical protein